MEDPSLEHHRFATILAQGDRRMTGRADEAVEAVLREPARVGELLECMEHGDAGVRMRASDAMQKAGELRPDLVAERAERILSIAETARQQEVQWHCAQLLRLLPLTPAQADRAEQVLTNYLADATSAIVRADAVETLALLAARDPHRRARAIDLICAAMQSGTASVRARGRRALRLLGAGTLAGG